MIRSSNQSIIKNKIELCYVINLLLNQMFKMIQTYLKKYQLENRSNYDKNGNYYVISCNRMRIYASIQKQGTYGETCTSKSI